MHIETAFLSIPVATAAWSAGTGGSLWSLRGRPALPLKAMALATAAVFAAQLPVFDVAVPGTGSSAHFCGGFLLALLLGPAAGILSLAAVLAAQVALLGDGSWSAFGANLLNMGVLPALLVLPLYRGASAGAGPWTRRGLVVAAGVLSIGLGGVLQGLEALASGTASFHWQAFATSLLPLHLAAGLGEGLLSLAVLELAALRVPALRRA